MIKICYIGVFRDGTGYSNAAIRNALALEQGGIDVVTRTVSLSQSKNHVLAKQVEHLEDKTTDGVDVVFQHILPHLFEYKANVKNIGFFTWETTHFTRSNWSHCCNLMDEIWVPSIQNAQAAKDSNVVVPIKIFPHSCDISKLNSSPTPLSLPSLRGKCVFYTIGEQIRRKNFAALLRAYYGTFNLRDDVALVIKTNLPGQSAETTVDYIRKMATDIKAAMHIYTKTPCYPPIIAITDYLPDNKLDQLHAACDVFVSPSHGEAWGIPAHDAMKFGKPVILSNWGAYPELAYGQAASHWSPEKQQFTHPGEIYTGWLIDGRLTPCFGALESFPDLYTASESWYDPDIEHLKVCMKQAYREWQDGSLHIRGQAAAARAREFSYGKIGKIARGLLNE